MTLSLISACPRRDPEPVFVSTADIFIGHDVVQNAENSEIMLDCFIMTCVDLKVMVSMIKHCNVIVRGDRESCA